MLLRLPFRLLRSPRRPLIMGIVNVNDDSFSGDGTLDLEEALQLAVEREIHKRKLSNGNQYQGDFSDEVFDKVYREPREALMEEFRVESGYDNLETMSVTQLKEFTYWLFKYRLKTSDKAKIASDTKKGLDALHQMAKTKPQVIRVS